MVDAIIDTNVLLVASASDPSSPFTDTHRSPEDCEIVLEWLMAFSESDASLVFDQDNRIYDEYHNKLQGGDLGLRVIYEKMTYGKIRQHVVEFESDGSAVVPETFAALDRSDRKFLAVAIADRASGHDSEIVNATDSDWRAIDGPCSGARHRRSPTARLSHDRRLRSLPAHASSRVAGLGQAARGQGSRRP